MIKSSLSTSIPSGGKKKWLLGEFEGRLATRLQGGGWLTDVWDGVRTGVSERLPSVHPVATSVSGMTDVLDSWRKEPNKTHRVASCSDFVGGRRAL